MIINPSNNGQELKIGNILQKTRGGRFFKIVKFRAENVKVEWQDTKKFSFVDNRFIMNNELCKIIM